MTNTRHFGYWVFGKDLYNVNLETLHKKGVTDIFLNYYSFNIYTETKIKEWIAKANKYNINTHIWMQCFYDGEWINPVTNKNIINTKVKEAKKYSNITGVKGVHLDYVRYPGNAYKTTNATDTVTSFVKKVKDNIPPNFLMS